MGDWIVNLMYQTLHLTSNINKTFENASLIVVLSSPWRSPPGNLIPHPNTVTRSKRTVSVQRIKKAKKAYAVVRTGQRRFYGSLVLRKGVIEPV
jgi:RbsD / FucU transport protein family